MTMKAAVRHVHGVWNKHWSKVDSMSPEQRRCCADLWERKLLGVWSSVPPTTCTVQGAQCTAYGLGTPKPSETAKPQAPPETSDPEKLPLRPEVNQMGAPKLSDPAEPQAAPAPLNPTLLLPPEVNQTSKSKLSGPTEPEALPVPRDPHKLPMRPDVNQMSASKHLNPAEPEVLPENSDPLRPEANQMGAPKPHKPAESQVPPVHRHPKTLRSRREVNHMGAHKLSGPAETQVPPVHLNQGTLRFRPEVGQMGTPMLFKSPDVQLCVYGPLNTRQWMPGPSGDDWDQWDESDKPDEPDTHDRASMNPVMFWLLTLMNCVFTLRGVLSLLDFSVERLRRREREERKARGEIPLEADPWDSMVQKVWSSGLGAILSFSCLLFKTAWWTVLLDFSRFMLFWEIVVIAVVAAMRLLWWGFDPAVSNPRRVLILPVRLSLVAVVGGVTGKVWVRADAPRDQAGLTLVGVGALLLASRLVMGLTDRFEKWMSSVCMAAGVLLAGEGAVVFLFPGPVRPGTGLELFAYSAAVIARTLWVVARWLLVSLWPFAPGIEVALSSVFGIAIAARLLRLTQETSNMTCMCAFALTSLWFGVCWWASPPPPAVATCLGVVAVWLAAVVLFHYSLKIELDKAGPLWVFLACATSTLGLTALVAAEHDADDW